MIPVLLFWFWTAWYTRVDMWFENISKKIKSNSRTSIMKVTTCANRPGKKPETVAEQSFQVKPVVNIKRNYRSKNNMQMFSITHQRVGRNMRIPFHDSSKTNCFSNSEISDQKTNGVRTWSLTKKLVFFLLWKGKGIQWKENYLSKVIP